MIRRYFVSYAWHHNGNHGYGNGTYDLKREIDMDLIRTIEKDISELNKVSEVAVISWQLMTELSS